MVWYPLLLKREGLTISTCFTLMMTSYNNKWSLWRLKTLRNLSSYSYYPWVESCPWGHQLPPHRLCPHKAEQAFAVPEKALGKSAEIHRYLAMGSYSLLGMSIASRAKNIKQNIKGIYYIRYPVSPNGSCSKISKQMSHHFQI